MEAGAGGPFAEHELEIVIADPPGGPENIRRVAAGDRDFCLTSVHHFLTARGEAGDLPARFVAVVVQRSPIAALVPAGSHISSPLDLGGCRLGANPDNPHSDEFLASLRHRGVGAPRLVPMDEADARLALGRGDVDAIVGFVDGLPRISRLVGDRLRAVHVGLDIYASGLVGADRLPVETIARMRAALVLALQRQRSHPQRGLAELCRRYPQTLPAEALEGWRLLEPNIFTGIEPGSMDPRRWETTLTFLSAARRIPCPPPHRVYRPNFADGGVGSAEDGYLRRDVHV